MPKVSVITDTAGNVAVTQSAIQTNFAQVQYVLEGRVDNDNLYDTAIATNLIVDAADENNPIVGDKYLGFLSSAPETFKTDIFDATQTLFDANVVPVLLEGKATFVLTVDPRVEPPKPKEPKKGFFESAFDLAGAVPRIVGGFLEDKTGSKLLPNLIQNDYFIFRKDRDSINDDKRITIRDKTVVFDIPKHMVPLRKTSAEILWGDTTVSTNSSTINTIDSKYMVDVRIDIDGRYGSDIAVRQERPKIFASNLKVSNTSLEIDFNLEAKGFTSSDYLTVDIIVQVLCELRP